MKKIIFGIVAFILAINCVWATSGRLRGDSIISCNGNTYGQHGDGHWHVAVARGNYWYPSGANLSTNPCYGASDTSSSDDDYVNSESNSNTQSIIQEKPKSNDTGLKEVKINDITFNFENNTYYTNDEKIVIKGVASSSVANVNGDGEISLNFGNNEIKLTVVAEDGTSREYPINVYRRNDNNKATIKFNSKKIKFKKNKSEQITVKRGNKKISFDVILKDNNAKSNVKNSYKLKYGKNKIKITVTAENGDKRKYIINVYRKKSLFG